jgi:hypothetical protein
MPIVLEVLWDSGVTVAADVAQNKGAVPQHVGHRADVEAGQAWVPGQVIEHGTSSLHDAIQGQVNGLKLHIHDCERALISKVTLLVKIHWSFRIMIAIGCISTLCQGRISSCKA